MFSGLNSSKKQEPRRTDKETYVFFIWFYGTVFVFCFFKIHPSWETGAKCLFLFLSVLEFFAVIVATLFVAIMFKLLAAVVVKMYGRGRGKWLFFSVTLQFILFKSFQLIMMFPGPDSLEQWFSKFLHHSPHCRNKYFHTPSKPNRWTEKPSCNFT